MNKARTNQHSFTALDKHRTRKRKRELKKSMGTDLSYHSLRMMEDEHIDWSAFFTWN